MARVYKRGNVYYIDYSVNGQKIREKAFGSNHPEVAIVLEKLAEFYRRTGKENQAQNLESV